MQKAVSKALTVEEKDPLLQLARFFFYPGLPYALFLIDTSDVLVSFLSEHEFSLKRKCFSQMLP